MVFLNKIYFERVTIFTKSPRFLKSVTKTVPNVIKEATLHRHNKRSLYHILVKNINIPPRHYALIWLYMIMIVTITKLDQWIRLSRKKWIRNIYQRGFFPYKKNTCSFMVRNSLPKHSISEVPHKFPSLLREYKLWVTSVMFIYSFKTNAKPAS